MNTDYSAIPVTALREIAKERGIAKTYKLKKQELIDLLTESDLEAPEEAAETLAEEASAEPAPAPAKEAFRGGEHDADSEEPDGEPEPELAPETEDEADDEPDVEPEADVEPDVEPEAEPEKGHRELPVVTGVLEVMGDGYGFLRAESEDGNIDYYVPHTHIRRFHLRTGDIVEGIAGDRFDKDKYAPIIYVNNINGTSAIAFRNRQVFDDLTPIYPQERIRLETVRQGISTRIVDLVAPVGKGQRGLIVSPPKAGKTTLLKSVAHAVEMNHPEIYLFILLIDERPEEVTDFERSVNKHRNADDPVRTEVIASTFDKPAHSHTQTAEALLDRAKRLVESGRDVMILMDSLTRLSRAYNISTTPSGRTLSGGLDPVALYPPKRFFGAARNIDGDGSLTILATCLKDTGSRMDDMIYEEFKGTGNMEVHLSRDLSELRIFPAIDILSSGTRREDLLLNAKEKRAMEVIRRRGRQLKDAAAAEQFVKLIRNTASNEEFCEVVLADIKG